ncbi:unnamed protein product [Medioppia subpectinata]|uniref:Uncharacterized protein n=1 Tax=Medioppia subpectinata TaxID=1979941 RepID=A0A7R9KWV0_9ACAR|nr:unnamed protein product [Medioppia subpectinata]CAG2110996.1 unnamed protein product [Medioppia subpectinata]
MYVFGGCTIANTTFNDLWRFDLSTRTWIRPIATGTFPSPKACASLVAYNNNLVLFGGWTHSSPYPIHQEWRIFNHIHIFDTIADRWSLIVPNSESPAIAGHSASIVGHHMIVFGGLRSEANNPLPFSSNNDIWVLDLKSFVWRKQITSNPKPLPRYGHSQVVIDDRHILIIGGSGGPNMLFSDIWMLCISEDTKQMLWKPIEVLNKDSSNIPQISFHPTCKVENLLVVLSQKVRPFQCKDGNILRKPSVRSQYVNTNDSNNKSSLNVKLESQSNAVSIASTSSASTSQQSQTNGNTSLRPLSRRNRQRQLEGLDRMEQRIRQLKSHTFSPLAVRSGTVKSDRESAQNPMQLFVLDLSDVIEKNVVKWIHKNHFLNDGPEEIDS